MARTRWPEAAWGVFAAANLAFIAVDPAGATVPFYNIWVSLTVLYGFRLWPLGATVTLLAAVCLGTAAAMAATDEFAEVPLMTAMFVAVVWHARRHQGALDEVHGAAEREREFVCDASHELRTPITVARGHAELVRAALPAGQTAADADVVISELDRLARIAERLLLLAAAEHVALARAPVDLGELVETTVRRWTPTAPRRWRVEVTAGGTVPGDVERLEAAVDALMENAVTATRPGGAIAVVLRGEGDEAIIEVVDDGVGIAEEDLDRVFDRFWTGSRHGRGSPGGTGLGLAAVKAIAEAHGGSVEAESLRGGATVRMRLRDFERCGLVGAAAGAT